MPKQRNKAKEKCLPTTIAKRNSTGGLLTTHMKPGSSIAFITAVFGDYEKSLKEPALQQGASAKFIAFCDEPFAKEWLFMHGYTSRGWTKAASSNKQTAKNSCHHDEDHHHRLKTACTWQPPRA